jgi:hypothetical protein
MACKATALATELYPQRLRSRPVSFAMREYKERERRRKNGIPSAHSLPRMCYRSLRKEVIQPHFPVRLPCYDFTPLTRHTFGSALLAVRLLTSGTPNSGGVTGGVYKARERIHRAILMRDY